MRSTGVRELTFRIVLEDPPAGVDFGLQIGRGAEYETAQTQRSTGKDLSFEFSVGVGSARNKTSTPPDFQGPVSSARLRSSSARWVLEMTPVLCCGQCFAHFFFSMQT